jgi:hypothetical protein
MLKTSSPTIKLGLKPRKLTANTTTGITDNRLLRQHRRSGPTAYYDLLSGDIDRFGNDHG